MPSVRGARHRDLTARDLLGERDPLRAQPQPGVESLSWSATLGRGWCLSPSFSLGLCTAQCRCSRVWSATQSQPCQPQEAVACCGGPKRAPRRFQRAASAGTSSLRAAPRRRRASVARPPRPSLQTSYCGRRRATQRSAQRRPLPRLGTYTSARCAPARRPLARSRAHRAPRPPRRAARPAARRPCARIAHRAAPPSRHAATSAPG